jgi:hypothetical protein
MKKCIVAALFLLPSVVLSQTLAKDMRFTTDWPNTMRIYPKPEILYIHGESGEVTDTLDEKYLTENKGLLSRIENVYGRFVITSIEPKGRPSYIDSRGNYISCPYKDCPLKEGQ